MKLSISIVTLAIVLIMCGCAGKGLSGSIYGGQLHMGFTPSEVDKKERFDQVNVVVVDARPQVKEGIIEPYDVGVTNREARSYYIALKDHTPFATQLSIDVYKELHANGFVKKSDENITLDIVVNQWLFKGFKHKYLNYDLNASVYRNGEKVVSVPFVAEVDIDVGFFATTLRGIGDDIPAIYRVLVKKIVQDPRIYHALSENSEAFKQFYESYRSNKRVVSQDIRDVRKQRKLNELDQRFEKGELSNEDYLEERYRILLP